MLDTNPAELMLDAAEELFSQQGFDATWVRAVTRHAGMPRRANGGRLKPIVTFLAHRMRAAGSRGPAT
jgi:hypothetical protein